ncbi:unnamed protein product, partial [marine sediment metagenome]
FVRIFGHEGGLNHTKEPKETLIGLPGLFI